MSFSTPSFIIADFFWLLMVLMLRLSFLAISVTRKPSANRRSTSLSFGDKRLSPKESEVLRLFAEGFLVTEIAKKLNRSIKTISSQKKSAMMKLGVENDIALLNYLSSVSLSSTDKD